MGVFDEVARRLAYGKADTTIGMLLYPFQKAHGEHQSQSRDALADKIGKIGGRGLTMGGSEKMLFYWRKHGFGSTNLLL